MIKALLITGAMLLTSVSCSYAGEGCNSISEMANIFMQLRQGDYALRDALNIVEQTAVDDERAREIAKAIVIEAWSVPAYGTEEYRQKAIREFTDKVLLTCVKGEVGAG